MATGNSAGEPISSPVNELPAPQLRPVTQVQILGEGVTLPAARISNSRFTPYAPRPIEISQQPGRIPATLLHGKMGVQTKGLQLGYQRKIFVQVLPAGLHNSHFRIGKVRDCL